MSYTETFIAVSRCVKVIQKNKYLFHFKGVFCGKKINKIEVWSSSSLPFCKDEDYILYLSLIEIRGDTIRAKTIKYKKLEKIKRYIF